MLDQGAFNTVPCSISQLESEWRNLDPIFIMGMQRSGTSILAIVLLLPGFTSFGEGHLWFEVVEPFSRFRNPHYRRGYRQDVFALGQQRNLLLEKYIALAIDQFHRHNIPEEPRRWVDKSPGPEAVGVAPILAEVFPKSQFLFVVRNGIQTVDSGIRLWHDSTDIFRTMCVGWAKTMSTWRRVRDQLQDRYLEVRQEDMAQDPDKVAKCLTEFLSVPEHREGISDLLRSHRANTAFPDRAPGDYRCAVDWSPEQKTYFVETCRREMEVWGYDFDFDVATVDRHRLAKHYGQPSPRVDERNAHLVEIETEYRALREHLRQVEQGRVMRLLNRLRELRLSLKEWTTKLWDQGRST